MANKHVKEMEVLKEHLGKHQLKVTRQRELILQSPAMNNRAAP